MTDFSSPPHFPGADHEAMFHSGDGSDWRSPKTLNGHRCDYSVYRLLAMSLADALGVRTPAEFAVLHGQAYDLVHDPSIDDEMIARERLGALIERMRRVAVPVEMPGEAAGR